MARLIIHLGLHKTGSSLIQESLALNSDALRSEGYLYPKLKGGTSGGRNHSIPLCILFSNAPMKLLSVKKNGFDRVHVKKLRTELRQEFECYGADGRNLILSGEGVSLLKKNELRSLKCFFENLGYSIEVIAFVRRPYDYMCSWMQQKIRGGEHVSMDIIRNDPSFFRSSDLKKIIDVFGTNTNLLSYDKSVVNGDSILSDFLNKLKLGDDLNKNMFKESSNIGMSNFTTRCLNRVYKNSPYIVGGKFCGGNIYRTKKSIKAEPFFLTKQEFLQIKDLIDKENESINRILGTSYSSVNNVYSGKLKIDLLETTKLLTLICNNSEKDALILLVYLIESGLVLDDELNSLIEGKSKLLSLVEKLKY